MPKPRRTLAAALVIGASAVALTGCILPPPLPEAPPAQPVASDPSGAPEASGDYQYTVDDGLGDTWSFSVTDVVANPPVRSGEPEAGTYFVGIVFDAHHDEGNVDFGGSFDVFVKGSDGETYDWMTTYANVTAEEDIYDADPAGFTGRTAVVQLPEGVDPVQVIVRSAYGHPEVPDTVIDVS